MLIAAYVVAAAVAFWIGMITAVALGGLGFVILTAILAGLKLAGIFDVSWWWVLLPLWTVLGGVYVKSRHPYFRKR